MATPCKWVTVLVMLLAMAFEVRPAFWPTLEVLQSVGSALETLTVFETGVYKTTTTTVQKTHWAAPPETLLLVSPTTIGVYPIILFVPSALVQNTDYSQLLEHIASHGYIVVAPQTWSLIIPSQANEIEMAASVVNWIPNFLRYVLPEHVQGSKDLLAVSGHGRGGKTAFALALGVSKTKLTVQISALIGLDPIEGVNKLVRTKPYILTYVPNSFDLSIPTMVTGTGLGNHSKIPFGPSCTPNGVNYEEYFNECRSGTLFVVAEFGHFDLLNDKLSVAGLAASAGCVSGKGGKDLKRRTTGGLVVAYLDSSFLEKHSNYVNIITNPSLAPARLDPIETKARTLGDGIRYYSEV